VARVILDTGTVTEFEHHFDIILSALLKALGLNELIL
jgi:hypothetical protein